MDVQTEVLNSLQSYASNPQTASAVASFAETYFGGLGRNLIGLLGSDWVYIQRIENIAKLAAGARRNYGDRLSIA